MIYWHGTTEAKLEGILANGLDPACTKGFDHVCLLPSPRPRAMKDRGLSHPLPS